MVLGRGRQKGPARAGTVRRSRRAVGRLLLGARRGHQASRVGADARRRPASPRGRPIRLACPTRAEGEPGLVTCGFGRARSRGPGFRAPHRLRLLHLLMRPAELEDVGKLLLRVLVAGLMMFHGLDKVVHGPGHVMQDLAEHGAPVVLGYGVYIGEVVAPILVLVGAWTRLAALVYAGSIAFATLQVQARKSV